MLMFVGVLACDKKETIQYVFNNLKMEMKEYRSLIFVNDLIDIPSLSLVLHCGHHVIKRITVNIIKTQTAMQCYISTLSSICSRIKCFHIFSSYFRFDDDNKMMYNVPTAIIELEGYN